MKTYRFLLLVVLILNCPGSNCHDTIVNVNGSNFHMKYFGNGNTTVIFECGMGMDLTTWRSIEDSVAAFSKVFMYNRLGLGQSDTTSRDRPIPNMVSELKALLNHVNIKPPYILVPHFRGAISPGILFICILKKSGEYYYWIVLQKHILTAFLRWNKKWIRSLGIIITGHSQLVFKTNGGSICQTESICLDYRFPIVFLLSLFQPIPGI